MAYTPPLGNAANFQAAGVSYTPPIGNEVDFSPGSAAQLLATASVNSAIQTSRTATASVAGAPAPVTYSLTNVGLAPIATAIPTLGPGALLALVAGIGLMAITAWRRNHPSPAG